MGLPGVDRSYLRLTRIYTSKFTVENWQDGSPIQLRQIRTAMLKDVKGKVQTAQTTAQFGVTPSGELTLWMSFVDSVPTADRIRVDRLDTVIRYADEAFRSLSSLVRETAYRFVQEDSQGSQELGPYQKFPLTDGQYHTSSQEALLRIDDLEINSIIVSFSVGPRLVAASREPKRLELFTEGTVVDYFDRDHRKRPLPDQYRIALINRSLLRIQSHEENVAEDVARALLDGSRGRPSRRPVDRWPPATTAYWGISTITLAIFAAVASFFGVTRLWLEVLAFGTALAFMLALFLARKGGASMRMTALGMFPSVIVLGFAVFYGWFMIGQHPSVKVSATHVPHLVDALLLSLGMASTGGFFDLALKSTGVRVAAFIEMLLMVSVAGSSLFVGARAAWRRLGDMLRGSVEG